MTNHVETTLNPESPWLGLRSYDEFSRDYFFGRDREIKDLSDRIRLHELTLLFGQSGLGKTSLLRAGVIPGLRGRASLLDSAQESDQSLAPVLIRLDYNADAEPLQTQVIRQIIEQVPELGHVAAESLDCISSDSSLWEFFVDGQIAASIPSSVKSVPSIVLLFDQFEEIWTHGQKRVAESNRFIETLASIIERRTPLPIRNRMESNDDYAARFASTPLQAKILLVLRDDYLHLLERWRDRMPSMMSSRFELRALAGPQAFLAVKEPGRKRTLLGGTLIPIVSDETAAGIVREAAGVSADTPLAEVENVPPLLSLLCEQLNAERLTQGADQIQPDSLGIKAKSVLQDFYQGCFAEFDASVQNYFEKNLVSTTGGHRESVTLQTAEDDLRMLGVDRPEEVIARLINRRLLMIDQRGGVPRLELTHDVLGPIAWRSRTQRKAADDELSAVHEAAARRLSRFKSALYAAVICSCLLSLAFGWLAWLERNKALDLSQTSDSLRQDADEQRAIADEQRVAVQRQVELAGKTHFFNGNRLINASPSHDLNDASTIGVRSKWQEGIANWTQSLELDRGSDAMVASELFAAMSSQQIPIVSDRIVKFPLPITNAFRSHDGTLIALVSGTTAFLVRSASFDAQPVEIDAATPIQQIVFSRAMDRLGILLKDGQIRLYDTVKHELTMSIPAPDDSKSVQSLCFSPTGEMLIANGVTLDRKYWVFTFADKSWSKGQSSNTEIDDASFLQNGESIMHSLKVEGENKWEVWIRSLRSVELKTLYSNCLAPIKHVKVIPSIDVALILVDTTAAPPAPVEAAPAPVEANYHGSNATSLVTFKTATFQDGTMDEKLGKSILSVSPDIVTPESISDERRRLTDQINVVSFETGQVIQGFSFTDYSTQLIVSNSQVYIDPISANVAICSVPVLGTGCGASADSGGRIHMFNVKAAYAYFRFVKGIRAMPDVGGFLDGGAVFCLRFPDGDVQFHDSQVDALRLSCLRSSPLLCLADQNRLVSVNGQSAQLWRTSFAAPSMTIAEIELAPGEAPMAPAPNADDVADPPPAFIEDDPSAALPFERDVRAANDSAVTGSMSLVTTPAIVVEDPQVPGPSSKYLSQPGNVDEKFSLLAKSIDSAWIAALSSKGNVAVWNMRDTSKDQLENGLPASTPTRRYPAITGLGKLKFSDDGKYLLMAAAATSLDPCAGTAHSKTDVQVLECESGKEVIPLHSGLQSYAFDPAQSRLLMIDQYGDVMLYRLGHDESTVRSIRLDRREVIEAAFEKDMNTIRFVCRAVNENRGEKIVWSPDGLADVGSITSAVLPSTSIDSEVIQWWRAIAGLEFSTADGNLTSIDDEQRFKWFHNTKLPSPWSELRAKMLP